MSVIPSFSGLKTVEMWDPFQGWDPSEGFFDAYARLARWGPCGQFVGKGSAITNAQIDCRETPESGIVNADLTCLKKDPLQGRNLLHTLTFLNRGPSGPFEASAVTDPFQGRNLLQTFTFLNRGGSSGPFEASAVTNAQVDWKETLEAHIFQVDLPGLKKEEVKIKLEEGQRVLQISGERNKEEEHKNDKWHLTGRTRGKFFARFPLSDSVKVEEIKARMEDGVLTVTVPKKPEPPSLTVQISDPYEDAMMDRLELC